MELKRNWGKGVNPDHGFIYDSGFVSSWTCWTPSTFSQGKRQSNLRISRAIWRNLRISRPFARLIPLSNTTLKHLLRKHAAFFCSVQIQTEPISDLPSSWASSIARRVYQEAVFEATLIYLGWLQEEGNTLKCVFQTTFQTKDSVPWGNNVPLFAAKANKMGDHWETYRPKRYFIFSDTIDPQSSSG